MQAALASPTMRQNKILVYILLLLAWTAAWQLPWQGLLAGQLWLQAALGILLFTLPGALVQQLIYHRQPFSVGRALTVGFVVSMALASVLGMLALFLHTSIALVLQGMFVVGAAALALLVLRYPPAWPPLSQRASASTLVLIGLAGLVMTLSALLVVSFSDDENYRSDYHVYNAYVTYYAEADRIGSDEIFLGSGETASVRFLVAMWPLCQAVLVRLTGVHILSLWQIISVLVMLLSLVAVYELARALGMDERGAWLAVLAHAALLFMRGRPQAGSSLLNLTAQDKLVVAFVLAPILMRVVVDYFKETQRRVLLGLVGVVGAATLLTHVTMFAVACMIVGLYSLGEAFYQRRVRAAASVIIVLALCLLVMVPTRFVEERFAFTATPDSVDPDWLINLRQDRLNMIEGTRFYGISEHLVNRPAYIFMFVGGLACLLFLRRSAPRYVAASVAVMSLAVIPYTGWLLGLGITPYHIYRVPWLMPFGITFALLVLFALDVLERWQPRLSRWRSALLVGAGSVCVGLMLWALPVNAFVTDRLLELSDPNGLMEQHTALVEVADYLETQLDREMVILTYPQITADYVPTLTEYSRTYTFRNDYLMHLQARMHLPTAQQRVADYNAWFGADMTDDERLAFLEREAIRYVLVPNSNPTAAALADAFPDRFRVEQRFSRHTLYRFEQPA